LLLTGRVRRPTRPTSGYDLVVFGATGFTGRLTAERVAMQGPDGLRWAIAGRDQRVLEELAATLADRGRAGRGVDVLRADVTDIRSMRALAEQTRVLATTVGPYVEYGDPVIAACAETGTDYADISGEPEFVDRAWLAHQESALRTGARLVHACGFDSIPHDLGALFTVQQLPDDVPIRLRGFVRVSATFSGGTYHSAIRAFSRLRQSSAVASQRRTAERAARSASGRRVRALPRRPVRAPDGRGWGLPLPTIDPTVVRRSARALDDYGPDFSYGHYALVRSLRVAAAAPMLLGGMVLVSQLPLGRDLLLRLRPVGFGPSPSQRARGWFKVRFVAETPGRRLVTEVAGGDPGYDETATMLAQSALCLAFDDLPASAGQLTPAQAMGTALRTRLESQGMTFSVGDDTEVEGGCDV
jgi:short subunit dehydrogenase-like uncharacterized protein